MEYGIGVKNKYEIFGLDVEDPDFIHISSKKQNTQKLSSNDVKKPLQKANTNTDKTKTVTTRTSTNQKTTVISNNVNFKNGDKKENRRLEKSSSGKDNKDSGRTEKTEDRGRFERKDGKFLANKDRKKPVTKKEFDRKSGSDKTSVKPTEKRDGIGKNNWGNFNKDENVQNESTENFEISEYQPETNEVSETNEEVGNVEPAGEERKMFTLDEWRKQEKEKRLIPKYNIRKAGEGDTQQWKKGYVLKKKDEDEEVEVIVYEEIEVDEIKQSKQKKVLDIDITFREDNKNGYGFRGGNRTGGNRSDRPRNDRRLPREDRPRDNAPRENRPQRNRVMRDIKSDREDRDGNRESHHDNNRDGNRENYRDDKKDGEDRKIGHTDRDDRKQGGHGDRDDRRDGKDKRGGHGDERRIPRRGDNEERRGPRPEGGQRRSGGNPLRGKGNKQAAPKFDDLVDFPNLASNKIES